MKQPLAALEIPLEPRSVHEEFSLFKPPEGEPKIRTSPQLLLATHRFLSRGMCVCVGIIRQSLQQPDRVRLWLTLNESQFNAAHVMIVLLSYIKIQLRT